MKKLLVLCMSLICSAMVSATAYAGTEITSLGVSFTEDRADPGIINNVELRVNNSNVTITEAEPSKNYDSWRPGEKITWSVVLTPAEGYSFNTISLKKVSAQNCEIGSAAIKRQRITLKINYQPKVTLERPENILFEDEKVATWDKVPYCDMYEVQIFKENDEGNYTNYKTEKLTQRKIDLSTYVTDGSDAYFKIRAIPKNAAQAKYLKNSEWTDSNEMSIPSDNTVNGNFNGAGDSMTFTDLNGVKVSGWQKINGNWYYFNLQNQNKAVNSSWINLDGKWYYFNAYSAMVTGWLNLDGTWYFLNGDGTMQTGWYCSGPAGPWYYLDMSSGALWVSTTTPDGYVVDANGAWYN